MLAEQEAARNKTDYRAPASLTMMVDTAVACVLPKMRVSPMGAASRNLSRNLALISGRGEVRCYWYTKPEDTLLSEDDETLDILLIPYLSHPGR